MIYEAVKNYIEKEPRAKERTLRDRAMVNFLLVKYPDLKTIKKETVIAFSQDFESYCRAWRKVLQDNPSLRGKDYSNKDDLESNKLQELGYL